MTIEELKRERKRLAADVAELVAVFQKRTGVAVADLRVNHLFADAEHEPIRTVIEVVLSIP